MQERRFYKVDMDLNVPQATMLPSNLSQISLPDSGIGSLESSYDCSGLHHLNDHSTITSGPFPSRSSGKSKSCPTTPRHSVSSGGHTHMHRQTSTPIHPAVQLTRRPASAKKYQATFPASYSPARRKQSCPTETSACPASCGTQVSRLTPVPEEYDETCVSLGQLFKNLNTKSDHLKTELESLSSGSLTSTGTPTPQGTPTTTRCRASSETSLIKRKPKLRGNDKSLSCGDTVSYLWQICVSTYTDI